MIYLLEDDESIRNFVGYALNGAGFETKGFEKPSEFYEALNLYVPELLIIDVMLPEEDGISVIKMLRKRPETVRLPIIVLSAKNTEYDKILGLDCGADDYISKPFSVMELLSRVKALLRRTVKSSDTENQYNVEGIEIFPENYTIKVDGEKITTTLKEFELLSLLIKNKGKVFSREKLLDLIWKYEFCGETRTVDVHVRMLRAKLGKYGSLIETVRGVGYKFSDVP